MKKAILGLMVLAGAVSLASASDFGDLLPYSNEMNGAVLTSTAVPMVKVAIPTINTAPIRIDSAVNTALSTALGANYKRAALIVQVPDGAAVNCNYSLASTTQTALSGFNFTANVAPVLIPLGKSIGIWCTGTVSTASFMVGGLGYK